MEDSLDQYANQL
jgi:hypothetical protein